MMKKWKPLTAQNFTASLKDLHGLSIVFFRGTDCSDSKRAEADLHQIDDLFEEHAVSRFTVDADQHAPLIQQFGLAGAPAFLFFKAGKPITKFTNYPGIGELRTAIISNLL